MTPKGNLTREQAVTQVGEQAVACVERESCEFTNRVTGDGTVEFSASISVGEDTLTAFYYQAQSDLDEVEEFDQLDWVIEGYEVA